MGEERLIEITSAISRLDGPLWVMGYVTTLKESDLYLLLRYVGSSKYRSMNLSEALFEFSHDYLKSKNINVMPLMEKVSDVDMSNNDILSVYVNSLVTNDNQVVHSGRK